MASYEIYLHTDSDIDSVTKLLNDKKGLFSFFKDKKSDFLKYDGGTGRSNLDRIYNVYNDSEKESITKSESIELLKVNTELAYPTSLADRELLSIQGKDQFLEQKDFNAFYGDALIKMLKDPKYRSNFKLKYNTTETLTAISPYLSVWVYCGAIDKIINVTPYLTSCSISVNKSGGSFSLTLPPIVLLEEVYKSGEDIYNSNVLDFKNEFYFHKYIQANDIVFIKFEKLDLEGDFRHRISLVEDFIIEKSLLANQVYDMIGLVDTNVKNTSYESLEASINIDGRDLMKLIEDDGSYFIPLQFVENSESLFVNLQDDDKLLKRSFITGKFESLFAFSLRDISTSVQFIINQLANIGVIDDEVDLFASYGQRRTKVYRIEGDDNTLTPKLHTGIWQIVKLLIDDSVSDRRVADSSVSQPDGSLMTQFQKLCQEPFVEFFGDTYGDTYNLIVRQPPFTKSQILSIAKGIVSESIEKDTVSSSLTKEDLILTINAEDVLLDSLTWESQSMYYSWYEITPQGSFIGSANQMALAYIPIVYLPQYANKWGLKKCSIVSNYISNRALTGNNSEINADSNKEAIMNDFKFIIDSNSYLPFTRRGTIVINGDRRFKRGTWVRYEITGELFYIDSVINEFSVDSSSINRGTTLMVSRGMVEKYTKGSTSYFDIVNTEFIKDVIMQQLTTGGQTQTKPRVNIKSNFAVNDELFKFFYNKKQFDSVVNSKEVSKFIKRPSSISSSNSGFAGSILNKYK